MKGLYIHIPFCKRKCKYCDFVSYIGREAWIDKYIDALKKEAAQYEGEKINTVFVGGGTPSLLSPVQINHVTKMCSDFFDLADACEFTMEVNPGTLDNAKMEAMLEVGVNRVSVGVQSFDDGELRKIGRIHDASAAYNTICELDKMGFPNISLDLMTALPDQTIESFSETLKMAVELPVKHISAYSLIIEDGTPLEREYSQGLLTLPDEKTDREMYHYTVDFLQQNGFFQYEISNFAKNGYECRHNVNYWKCGEYIGLGAAAHSHLNGVRYCNVGDMEKYISGEPHEETVLSDKDKIAEFMIMGLRMNVGISEKEFKMCFGKDISDVFGAQLERFVKLELMKYEHGNYSLTPKGIDISNSILCEFV